MPKRLFNRIQTPDTVAVVLMGPDATRGVVMSCFRNICCCAAATCTVLINPGDAIGDPLPTSASTVQETPHSLPDVGDVVAAYTQARRWLDAFQLPRIDEDDALIPIREAHGVCVLLRHSGRIVGVGHDQTGDDLMLRRALGRAMSQALGDPVISRLPDELRDTVGRALVLELDAAGQFIPVPGRTFDQIAHRFDPGLDGVTMRRDRQWSISYPAQMQATNAAANFGGLLSGLATELGLSLRDIRAAPTRGGLTCYRFRSIHLAQNGPDAIPFQAFRGDPLQSREQITETDLHALAEMIVAHVSSTQWPREKPTDMIGDFAPPAGIKGDYLPVSDAYKPIVAGALDQALTAFALLRYAGVAEGAPNVGEKAAHLAHSILNDLVRLDERIRNPGDDPVLCAVLVYALCEVDGDDRNREMVALFDAVLAGLLASVDEDGASRNAPSGSRNEKVDPHGRALIAGALSRTLRLEIPNHPRPEFIRDLIDTVWESLPEHRHVSLLPWIGWAESDLARSLGDPLAQSDRLTALWRILQASRITANSGDSAPDLIGGFNLTDRRAGSPPRATAQSLRPAAWMASHHHPDQYINDGKNNSYLQGHFQTLGFLTQLMVCPGSEWRYRSPNRAMGGIRAALWDLRQPVAAQAMGLLTIAETLRSPHFSSEKSKLP